MAKPPVPCKNTRKRVRLFNASVYRPIGPLPALYYPPHFTLTITPFAQNLYRYAACNSQ